MVLTQELDCVLDELAASFRACDERRKAGRRLVPASDGQQSLQVLIVGFEASKLGVTALVDVLVLVEWLEGIVCREAPKSVN